MADAAVAHEEQFESFERQKLAARLGMWVFLASEVLLFSGLFALYATERALHPSSFAFGVHENLQWVGTANTFVLLTSSFLVAMAVHVLREDRRRAASWLVLATLLLGVVFLALKGYEYQDHITHGAVPGGRTAFFEEHAEHEGLPAFFNLYWISTAAHALHVSIGILVLSVFAVWTGRGRLTATHAHRLEIAAIYWHLVDAIWIFLWPLYYLLQ